MENIFSPTTLFFAHLKYNLENHAYLCWVNKNFESHAMSSQVPHLALPAPAHPGGDRFGIAVYSAGAGYGGEDFVKLCRRGDWDEDWYRED